VIAVAIGTYRWGLARGDLFGRDIVAFVALKAHRINLVAREADIGRRGTNVLVVGVAGAETVTADASDSCSKVGLTQLFFDERDMAHITSSIGTECIGFIKLSRKVGGFGCRRTA